MSGREPDPASAAVATSPGGHPEVPPQQGNADDALHAQRGVETQMSRLSLTPVTGGEPPLTAPPVATRRRVRHEVRDGLAVMVFSAAASTTLAFGLLLLSRLAAGTGN